MDALAESSHGKLFLSGQKPAMKEEKLQEKEIKFVVTCNADRGAEEEARGREQQNVLARLGIAQERLDLKDSKSQFPQDINDVSEDEDFQSKLARKFKEDKDCEGESAKQIQTKVRLSAQEEI
uniref:Uncharacterized protein n=1 Tax=Chromera velia CCMP2878 TaxID=1169474 RepID=A0A0G4H8I0_9ALVE|eukprot:Cvel_25156.t1-p1 / transcript=Cvel_25156.t1 / gene=Cvel_25156 / organism=Chromera_velia_CCMP2878 / gene_product=hypothetical protein / transcript_product=hypothetical protein / location=Cvel_scaffold2814:5894-9592(-) / protein_length=122 / sequence_SO=supercontig / SO=protein_coding / is_pseudo=false